MLLSRVISILLSLLFIQSVAHAQDPYVLAPLDVREAKTNDMGVLDQPYMALTNANVVDVRTGNILRDVTLVLQDGKISSIGNDMPPQDAQIIDIKGYYVTPGLFEGHFHGATAGDAKRALVSGVTTAKGASVDGFMDVALSRMVDAGYMAGPEIMPAGVYVTPELGNTTAILADERLYKYANRELYGEEALRDVVSINIDRGAKWIKTRSSGLSSRTSGPDALEQAYTDSELGAVMDEASKYNIPVSCHSHGVEVIIAAINAGCTSIEHASYIDDEGLRLMKEKGTLWIPTYISVTGFELPHDDYTTTIARQRHPHLVENLARMIRKGHEMGITILTAVDSSYGPESVYRVSGEINAFIDFGMTPLEALQAATIKSAEAYGMADKTGAVEVGLDADLVLFDRDPLLQPSVIHNPLAVISNGRIGLNRHVGAGRVLGDN
ncbi:MAG: amidohydrolase family protein [Kordiimonadaceae bacterium]|jgi:imidazolonepropionase-like amidohydrolase|nr:amidohydrolase family protein [Kordiimonadaceae bacterium]MBT6031063.1 amidohydrolase family protein [Kordiimonadaceae bacterium]